MILLFFHYLPNCIYYTIIEVVGKSTGRKHKNGNDKVDVNVAMHKEHITIGINYRPMSALPEDCSIC